MVQRGAAYPRKPDEHYGTPAKPVLALIPYLKDIRRVWVPSDRGRDSVLAATLRAHGIWTVSSDTNFLATHAPPNGVDAVIDNPPFGIGGRLAVAFAEHAIHLVPFTALLLLVDFDSGRTRAHLFRDNPSFAGRLILLQRIVWFENGPAGPSANHIWGIWDRAHCGPPFVHYEAEANLSVRGGRRAISTNEPPAAHAGDVP
jgi:hypothetical protein